MDTMIDLNRNVRLDLTKEMFDRLQALCGDGKAVDAALLVSLIHQGLELAHAQQEFEDEQDAREEARLAGLGFVQPLDDIVCDPELVAEYQAVRDRVRRLKAEARTSGRLSKVAVTLKLDPDYVLIAAYLAAVAKGRGFDPRKVAFGVHFDAEGKPQLCKVIQAYMEHQLKQHLQEAMDALDDDRHICFRPKQKLGLDQIPF